MRNINILFYIVPVLLVDEQLTEFYNKIAKQLYHTINPRIDEDTEENKLLSTIADVKLLEEVQLDQISYKLQYMLSYSYNLTGASASS